MEPPKKKTEQLLVTLNKRRASTRQNDAVDWQTPHELRLPVWARLENLTFVNFPESFRAKCEHCRGRGTTERAQTIADCPDCHAVGKACDLHKCRPCDGTGGVCPTCRGMRYVRTRAFSVHNLHVTEARCFTCMRGNTIDRDLEDSAITAYMARWSQRLTREQIAPTTPPDPFDWPARPTADQVAQYRADWLARNGDSRDAGKGHQRCSFCNDPATDGSLILPVAMPDGLQLHLCRDCRGYLAQKMKRKEGSEEGE